MKSFTCVMWFISQTDWQYKSIIVISSFFSYDENQILLNIFIICTICNVLPWIAWINVHIIKLIHPYDAPFTSHGSVSCPLQASVDIPSLSVSERWQTTIGEPPIQLQVWIMEEINNIEVVPCTDSDYLKPFRVHYNQVSNVCLITGDRGCWML